MTKKWDLQNLPDHCLHKVWPCPLCFRTLIFLLLFLFFYKCSCCPWAGNEKQSAKEQVHWADSSSDTQIYEGSLQTESAQI